MADESLSLTIFLLKKDQVAVFDQRFPPADPTALPLSAGLEGRFVPLPSTQHPPQWVSAVESLLAGPIAPPLLSQSPAGLLVVARAGRTFVLTFGHAWQRLEDAWLERDFGRRVALNLIAKDGLLEIHAEQVFAKWHVARERAPRATTVEEFGVEFDRDLVGAVEGAPRNKKLGKTIRGATSLRVTLALSQLGSFLDRAEGWFLSNAYKKNWPDIDNLAPVKDQALIGKLETQLDNDLSNPAARKRIVMFTPTFRRDEPSVVDSYVYGRMSKSPAKTPYLTIDGWVSFLDGQGLSASVAEAQRSRVHLLDDAGEEAKVCNAFQCFGYEVGFGGRQYVLASGIWYEVVSDFLKRVERTLAKIDSPGVTLPPWNQVEDEGTYNERCSKSPAILHFDAKMLRFGGGQAQLEFCDVFHPKRKTLIFAKIVSRSSGMSHLVEQVRRTAELLFSADGAYRKELKKVFKKYYPKEDSTWLDSRPMPGDWELCLASLGRSAKELPFFAKCSLMNLHRDLRERGHKVSFGRV
jgi:uncharacterized protein (TIGR04141 family)